ncbi:hypothetical protein HYX70_02175 [Candidatus Saccharibacteria bacterium]|nr:hypothetical protein [Candidatus Saccharibacteria bacterium]
MKTRIADLKQLAVEATAKVTSSPAVRKALEEQLLEELKQRIGRRSLTTARSEAAIKEVLDQDRLLSMAAWAFVQLPELEQSREVALKALNLLSQPHFDVLPEQLNDTIELADFYTRNATRVVTAGPRQVLEGASRALKMDGRFVARLLQSGVQLRDTTPTFSRALRTREALPGEIGSVRTVPRVMQPA